MSLKTESEARMYTESVRQIATAVRLQYTPSSWSVQEYASYVRSYALDPDGRGFLHKDGAKPFGSAPPLNPPSTERGDKRKGSPPIAPLKRGTVAPATEVGMRRVCGL